MMPSCDHTGTPRHFHSSTTSGSACLNRARSRPSISPRQSPSSLILASISCEGVLLLCDPLFFILLHYHGDADPAKRAGAKQDGAQGRPATSVEIQSLTARGPET